LHLTHNAGARPTTRPGADLGPRVTLACRPDFSPPHRRPHPTAPFPSRTHDTQPTLGRAHIHSPPPLPLQSASKPERDDPGRCVSAKDGGVGQGCIGWVAQAVPKPSPLPRVRVATRRRQVKYPVHAKIYPPPHQWACSLSERERMTENGRSISTTAGGQCGSRSRSRSRARPCRPRRSRERARARAGPGRARPCPRCCTASRGTGT